MVAYSNEAKSELLGVPAELIEQHGAVSPEVAEAMADGALQRFDADVACSITGVAGPDGGTEEKPVGYVCFCAKLADGTVLARDPRLPGSRDDIRDRSVTVALHMLRWLLARRGAAALESRAVGAAAAIVELFPLCGTKSTSRDLPRPVGDQRPGSRRR